jgi:hypothetical protein
METHAGSGKRAYRFPKRKIQHQREIFLRYVKGRQCLLLSFLPCILR